MGFDDVELVAKLLKVALEVSADDNMGETSVSTWHDRRPVGFGKLLQKNLRFLVKTDDEKEAAKEDRKKSMGGDPRLFHGGEKRIVSTDPTLVDPFAVHDESTHGRR